VKEAEFSGTECVYVQNEYGLDKMPRIPMVTWSNIEQSVAKFVDSYVNWNMLTYGVGEEAGSTARVDDGIFYYGAYRKGREGYFRKYFRDPSLPVYISTSKKNAEKFSLFGSNIRAVPPLAPLITGAAQYAMALYIEDTYTHRVYNSPANRFYEMLSAGTAMVFDKSCLNTFRKAGYDITPYIVNSPAEVKEKLVSWREIAARQAADWRRDYRKELRMQVEEANCKLARCSQ